LSEYLPFRKGEVKAQGIGSNSTELITGEVPPDWQRTPLLSRSIRVGLTIRPPLRRLNDVEGRDQGRDTTWTLTSHGLFNRFKQVGHGDAARCSADISPPWFVRLPSKILELLRARMEKSIPRQQPIFGVRSLPECKKLSGV
jgi:hypothetical protein